MTNTDWIFVYSEIHSLLLNEIFFHGFTDYTPIPGMLKTVIYVNREGLQICYVPQEELNRIKDEGKIFFDPQYRVQFQKQIASCAEKFKEYFEHYKMLNLEDFSNADLLKLFENYLSHLKIMFAFYQVSGGRSFPLLEQRIKEDLAKYFSNNEVDKSYSLILTPTSVDILNREEIDLRKLAQKELVSENDLRNHAQKYSLLFFGTYDEKAIFNSINSRISEAKKNQLKHEEYLDAILKAKKAIEKEQNEIMQKIADKELTELIYFLREQGKLRFEYKEWKNGAEYKFFGLFKELAKRIGLPVEEYLKTYCINDTKAFLESWKKVSDEERIARKKLFVFFQENGKKQFFSGDDAEKTLQSILGAEQEMVFELKGTTANPGQIEGRAKIVVFKGLTDLHKDFADFNEGDILITTMTQPNMIFLMKKAAAIVTDQGGMTSHAAIIAREFGIPCIVGTYKATQVFKTGDLLEVDATKGIVKKIKRNE